MNNFTPVSALIGSLLIGFAASLLLWLNGRIAGISGALLNKMKRKYRKLESAKTIPENPIVPCGAFYEVNLFHCTENGFLADVFTQSGP